jgi:hypothetical protein
MDMAETDKASAFVLKPRNMELFMNFPYRK